MKGLELLRVFQEPGVSGSVALEARPMGGELYRALQPGDTLIVAKLDRAFPQRGRGADRVTDKGVAKRFFGMLALVAEFEREPILVGYRG
jgi:DNA invertase Pin-like site-specific DNA recombinase